MTANRSNTEVDTVNPVLVALAQAHPELDGIRWRVTRADGTREYLRGDKLDTGDSRVLVFQMDDGTVREFQCGEWVSARGMPGNPGPDLKAICDRLFAFDLITVEELLKSGSWLQAQPEWIAEERRLLADDPEALRLSEGIHTLRKLVL